MMTVAQMLPARVPKARLIAPYPALARKMHKGADTQNAPRSANARRLCMKARVSNAFGIDVMPSRITLSVSTRRTVTASGEFIAVATHGAAAKHTVNKTTLLAIESVVAVRAARVGSPGQRTIATLVPSSFMLCRTLRATSPTAKTP
jgi:hypothetical protein